MDFEQFASIPSDFPSLKEKKKPTKTKDESEELVAVTGLKHNGAHVGHCASSPRQFANQCMSNQTRSVTAAGSWTLDLCAVFAVAQLGRPPLS